MRVAALDFGSNSLKCLVAEITPQGIIYGQDIRILNRLGSALDEQGRLSSLAIDSCVAAVNTILSSLPALDAIKAVGTEALRKARNSHLLIDALKNQCDLQLKIISGAEEAHLAWKGVLSALPNPDEDLLLFDSGGSSTEFIHSSGGRILSSLSLPIGAVSLTKSFVHSDPIYARDFAQLSKGISDGLKLSIKAPARLVATGGGVLACAKVATQTDFANPSQLDGYALTQTQLSAQIELYGAFSLSQRKQIPGLEAERADIILSAAMLYLEILRACSAEAVTVSSRGLRHGLISENWDA